MPLYEYKCRTCGAVVETLQKFSDPPLTTHEDCGGKLERQLSPPAFQFKGTGWYITDYARGGGNGKNGSKKESGSESKVETKTEPKKTSSSDATSKP